MKTILIGLILVFVSSISFAANTNGLPEIKDAGVLRKDCAQLYQQFPTTEGDTNTAHFGNLERNIPTNNWPESVWALQPFKVSRDKYGVLIWILRDPNDRLKRDFSSNGYYVRKDPNLSPPRFAHSEFGGVFDLENTKFEGIDIFFLPSGIL